MATESKEILSILHKKYPNLKYYLNYSNHLELVVAAILSPQVKDEIVNAATPELFKKYKTAKDFADADFNELFWYIKSITFAGNKTKHIIEACKILNERYKSNIPKTVDELSKLPGIGRKTAQAILQNAFDLVEGIVVDTHVLRISYRLGWSDTDKKADKSEKDLIKIIPKNEWKTLPWLLKAHGREVCIAPVPKCSICLVKEFCPKKGV